MRGECLMACAAWKRTLERASAAQVSPELPEAFAVLGFAFYVQPMLMPLLHELPPGPAGVRITSTAVRWVVMGVASLVRACTNSTCCIYCLGISHRGTLTFTRPVACAPLLLSRRLLRAPYSCSAHVFTRAKRWDLNKVLVKYAKRRKCHLEDVIACICRRTG